MQPQIHTACMRDYNTGQILLWTQLNNILTVLWNCNFNSCNL